MNKKICIIGLGYVGLPLAHAFSKKYSVVGFDINKPRVDELNAGFDRTLELTETEVKESIETLKEHCQFLNAIQFQRLMIIIYVCELWDKKKNGE